MTDRKTSTTADTLPAPPDSDATPVVSVPVLRPIDQSLIETMPPPPGRLDVNLPETIPPPSGEVERVPSRKVNRAKSA
jgi:hypothetical protein